MNKNLYDMKEGEIRHAAGGRYEFLRVPGGWTCTAYSEEGEPCAMCFIPFDNEFQPMEASE